MEEDKPVNTAKEKLRAASKTQSPQSTGLWSNFKDWIWEIPAPTEPGWQKKLRAFFRVNSIVMQEFAHDRIPLQASALTFTVILSLVPMLALGTAVLKGLGGGGQMRQAAYAFIDTLEFTEATVEQQFGDLPEKTTAPELLPNNGGNETVSPEKAAKVDETLTIHLRKAVDTVFDYVDRTNFATLGVIGVLGLLLTVIAFLNSIEQALNAIWQAKSGRPISRQIMNYLGLMILLPLAVYLALATMATVQSPTLLAKLGKTIPLTWSGANIFKILPILAVIATFTLIYKYLPSSRVRFSSALIGGIIGGFGWILVQGLYLRAQFGVARYNAIYGSFATLPLFLLWVYVAWIIFLIGAEFAFAAQVWERYQRKKIVLNPLTRLAISFDIIDTILADFKARKTSNLAGIARRLRQPDSFVAEVLDTLLAGGILRLVNEEEEEYVPAAPAEEIRPTEIVDLVLGTKPPKMRGSSLALTALNGARTALEDSRLGRKSFPADRTDNQEPPSENPTKI